MKKILISFSCFLLLLFVGCNENSSVLPVLNHRSEGKLVSMPFRIEASMSTTGSVRGLGFGLGSTSGDGITPQILFNNWDNGENKPKVLLVVRSAYNIDWAKVLDPSEYEYTTSEDGRGIIRMTTTIKYLENPRLEESFDMYVFDKDVKYSLSKLTDSDRYSRYYIKIIFPTLDKDPDGYYSLDPLVKQKYKLIFYSRYSMEINDIKRHFTSKKSSLPGPLRNIRLYPMGTLFAFRLKNISKEDYPILSNNYMIRFKLSDIYLGGSTAYDCWSRKPIELNFGDRLKFGVTIDHTKIDKNDNSYYPPSHYHVPAHSIFSTYIKLNVNNPTVLKPGAFSVPYAIYVLPLDNYNEQYKPDLIRVTHPYFNTSGDLVKEDYLFKPDKTFNFYSEYMDKSVSFTLDVPSGNGGVTGINDFIYAGDIANIYDSGSGSWSDGNTDNFDNAGNLPSNQSLN